MKINNYLFATLLFSVLSFSAFSQSILLNQNFDSIPPGGLPNPWTASSPNMTSIGWYADSSNFSTGYTNASGLKNAVIKNINNSTGLYALISPSFVTTGKSGINVLWASRVSSNFMASGSTTPKLYYSINAGTTWDTAHYTDNAANSTWALVNNGLPVILPSLADNQPSVLLKWELQIDSAANGTYRIDDVTVGYTSNSNCTTPSNLTVTNITSSTAMLNWATVTGAVSYNIRYKLSSSSTWNNATSNANSFSLTALTDTSSYDFEIQTVCGSINNSAFSATSTFITRSAATGIEQFSNGNSPLLIYPNPCGQSLIISHQSLVNTIEVYDLIGKVYSDFQINTSSNSQIKIDMSQLSNGIYFLKTTDIKGFQQTKKFIKE